MIVNKTIDPFTINFVGFWLLTATTAAAVIFFSYNIKHDRHTCTKDIHTIECRKNVKHSIDENEIEREYMYVYIYVYIEKREKIVKLITAPNIMDTFIEKLMNGPVRIWMDLEAMKRTLT